LDADAGFRRGSRVLKFDPTDALHTAYNPLREGAARRQECATSRTSSDILVDPVRCASIAESLGEDAATLLVGAILHVSMPSPDKTLAGVAHFPVRPKLPFEATCVLIMSTPHLGRSAFTPSSRSAAGSTLEQSDNERSGVLPTAMSFLGLYRDAVVAKVDGPRDCRIADLMRNRGRSAF